ncbi:MAG: sugar-binding domain-containing protein [Candidatus Acidiferrales bacterium]
MRLHSKLGKNSNSRPVLSSCLCAALVVAVLVAISAAAVSADPENNSAAKVTLQSGWRLQSSCQFSATGDQISATGFKTDGWHSTDVPSTVVAALVADKTYPDPYYAMNLRDIPGTTYPIGKNFSLLPMPQDSPFRCSWWYRTEFKLPENFHDRHVWLHFGGINNRANIWLNGHQIAAAKDVAGAYRTYEYDITPFIQRDQTNTLAVETIAQTEKDLGINWVDWNPAPPDKDMGLWRPVYLQASGPVAIRYPQVMTHFPTNLLDQANLAVEVELHNATDDAVTGVLEGKFDEVNFRQTTTLQPHETKAVRFLSDQYPQLQIKNPKLWWPYQMGPQDLHELSIHFTVGNEESDAQTVKFGIREITSELNSNGARQFYINGRKILIRGGGWSPDMLLRQDLDRLQNEFRYVRDMNLNTIRLEGKLETEEFYNLADEQGVLIMAGWCCCDHWEQWKHWQPGDLEIATASLHSQIMRMRSHPSMLVWLNGSDNPPPANVESAYIKVLKESDWPNPYISSASATPTSVTGQSGVKMTGPYDYVPPDYWLTNNNKYGGAFGFNTETSPGPAVPLQSCLKNFIPAGHMWPQDIYWNYHAGSEGFKDLSHFNGAMNAIYGPAKDLDTYELKSQTMAYEGERAMFEAYSHNKYQTTGIIQWMLNNAWPSTIWHLFDYYLQPAGGYFGTKKACEPLHVQYSYDDNSIAVVNSRYEKASGLTVTAKLYDVSLQQRFATQVQTDVDADGVRKVLTLPAGSFNPASPAYFVALELQSSDGKIVSRNFYWLSSKPNTYEWAKTTYRFTPVSSYEDLTALQTLPEANIESTGSLLPGPDGPVAHVLLKNTSDHLAFQIRLGIRKSGQPGEILPVFWDDNYIELMPGESRELTARYLPSTPVFGGVELTVSGWNIAPATIPLKEGRGLPPASTGGGR